MSKSTQTCENMTFFTSQTVFLSLCRSHSGCFCVLVCWDSTAGCVPVTSGFNWHSRTGLTLLTCTFQDLWQTNRGSALNILCWSGWIQSSFWFLNLQNTCWTQVSLHPVTVKQPLLLPVAELHLCASWSDNDVSTPHHSHFYHSVWC